MAGRRSRTKGSAGEREAAKELSALTGLSWRRGLNQTRFGGKETADVVCEDLPGLHVEVKRQKSPRLFAALEQAIEDASHKDQLPVVLAKRNRDRWVIMLKLSDFESLTVQLIEARKRLKKKPPPLVRG